MFHCCYCCRVFHTKQISADVTQVTTSLVVAIQQPENNNDNSNSNSNSNIAIVSSKQVLSAEPEAMRLHVWGVKG